MARIHVSRLILGGLVAGAITFFITGLTNGILLNNQLEGWAQGMGPLIHPPHRFISLGLWSIQCLIIGVVGLGIYAGLLARCGAGSKTALLAGFMVWLINKLAVALDFIALGLLPSGIVLGQLIGGFIAILVGVLFGAKVYKE
jgi:hypothetical protein